ncbi:MAG: hypothetical protein QOJ80_4140 [Mycobacterium sp.]|jgi:hypothetical protein|nr:hypothetical protein [Mycobacterium sp.]
MQDTRTRATLAQLGAPVSLAVAAGLMCTAVWVGDPTTPGGPLPVCITKSLFGIDCPGCGGLRMVYSILHGDLYGALKYNALGLAALGLLVWAWAAWTYGRVVDRKIRSWQHHRWAAVGALVVVSVWFVIRNLPFAPFTGLYV